jgi:plasmanylethanolamine desaturase
MKSVLKSFISTDFSYPVYHRITEIIAVVLFVLYSVLLFFALASTLFSYSVPAILVGLLVIPVLGFIAADFASGMVHFLCDNFGTPETPWLGPSFIKSFRDHHTDPKGITRHDFLEVNGSNCFVSLFVLVPLYHYSSYETSTFSLLVSGFFLSMLFFVFLTNQFHKWAHADVPPKWIQKMQNAGIILNPKHHEVHHTIPYNKYYCITCGWLNPFLTKLRFFEGMEKLIIKIFRAKKAEY